MFVSTMKNRYLNFLLISYVLCGFSFTIPSFKKSHNNLIKCQPKPNVYYENEKKLYGSYLIGLRKTRRLLKNTSNVNTLFNILNFTNDFVSNNTKNFNNIYINHTEISSKNIVMGNIILDVSTIKYIHIKTEKDHLIVELDKTEKQNNMLSLFGKINNLEAIISTVSIFGKIINIG